MSLADKFNTYCQQANIAMQERYRMNSEGIWTCELSLDDSVGTGAELRGTGQALSKRKAKALALRGLREDQLQKLNERMRESYERWWRYYKLHLLTERSEPKK